MKELYFIYNSYTAQYIFYEGRNQFNRREFKNTENPLKILENLVDKKRKSKLHLMEIPQTLQKDIEERFGDTKISIELE